MQEAAVKKYRINKYLAMHGVCSRRDADKYIDDGRIKVNGEILINKGISVTEYDDVCVDGKHINNKIEFSYIFFYKPDGVVSSYKRFKNEKILNDIIKTEKQLHYAGRLDKDSQGLMILTNDGYLTDYIISPKSDIEKEYEIIIDKYIDCNIINIIEKGYINLGDFVTKPCKIRGVKKHKSGAFLKIIISEGKKREIRRLFKKYGFKVMFLKRIRIGPFKLDKLKPGQYYSLSREEVYEKLGIRNVGDRVEDKSEK